MGQFRSDYNDKQISTSNNDESAIDFEYSAAASLYASGHDHVQQKISIIDHSSKLVRTLAAHKVVLIL